MLTEYLLYSYVLNVCVHSCDMNTCVWCRIAHQDPIMVHCHRRRNAALCCHVLNAQCCRHLCSHLLCHLQLPWIDSIRLMRSVKPYYIVCHSTDNSILPQAGVQSIMLSMSVCLTARITRNRLTGLYQIFVHVACGYVSVLLWQHCDTLCTSGFMDGIMFSYHGANGPESSTTLCLEEVRQVAVSVGHQTTTVLGWVHQNAAPEAKSVIYDLCLSCILPHSVLVPFLLVECFICNYSIMAATQKFFVEFSLAVLPTLSCDSKCDNKIGACLPLWPSG